MKLDIVVLAAHPDDAELGCGGTILKHIAAGKKVGIVDFTRGELGTRGTAETRDKEASDSAKILGISVRENLNLPDGFFVNSKEHQLAVVKAIRKYKPEIVLSNATYDRHPDHGRGSDLAYEACFLSGLVKVETENDGVKQEPWRPRAVYQYIQSEFIVPDFIVDISGTWEKKMEAIKAFRTQFYDPSSKEPETYISNPAFQKLLEARAVEFGHVIGVTHGEGFTSRRWIGVKSLFDLF
jgi:N-acetylglucosamine malate deacetylase 1